MMKANLGYWEEMFEALTEFKERFGHCRPPSNWPDRSLLKWLEIQTSNPGRLSAEQVLRLYETGVDFDKLESKWLLRFSELCQFRDQYGHCAVPESYSESPSLMRWVRKQRLRKSSCSLARLRWLNTVGFDWTPEKNRRERRFQELAKFKERYGHVNVPSQWPENKRLGEWVTRVRSRKARLLPEERHKLYQLGFEWGKRRETFGEIRWKTFYQELQAFYEKFGHIRVPWHWEESPKLPRWITGLRHRKQRLTADQRRALDALHFEWNPFPAAWEKAFQELKQYKERFGDCRVPPHPPGSPYLYGWVCWHRNQGKRLPATRIERLNSLGFDWHPNASVWEKRYQELKEFQKKHGHCLVPFRWRKNPTLARWVRHTRNRRAQISADRKQRLDEIGFDWFPEETAWEEQVKKLIEYKEKHGHCNPTSWSDGKLGKWVDTVRGRRRKGRLPPDKIAQLTALGLRWNAKIIK